MMGQFRLEGSQFCLGIFHHVPSGAGSLHPGKEVFRIVRRGHLAYPQHGQAFLPAQWCATGFPLLLLCLLVQGFVATAQLIQLLPQAVGIPAAAFPREAQFALAFQQHFHGFQGIGVHAVHPGITAKLSGAFFQIGHVPVTVLTAAFQLTALLPQTTGFRPVAAGQAPAQGHDAAE